MADSNWQSLFTSNATEISVTDQRVTEVIEEFLCKGEEIHFAFRYKRDMVLFTSHRYIFINLQNLKGEKISRFFIPWKHLVCFTTENAGGLIDGDHDINFTFAHTPTFQIQIKKSIPLTPITQFLSEQQFKNL